jgi:hypothetical protein
MKIGDEKSVVEPNIRRRGTFVHHRAIDWVSEPVDGIDDHTATRDQHGQETRKKLAPD